MTILVDMDGVICTEEKMFERALARPAPGAREALEALRAQGHTVVIYSARSWSELKMTEKWLAEHKIPYNGIHLGKPIADRIIDDRAIEFSDWPTVQARLNDKGSSPNPLGDIDEQLLRILRTETKTFLTQIAGLSDLMEPVFEVGPMTAKDAANSPVFARMPETFVDSRKLFESTGKRYVSVDIDASARPDICADFAEIEKHAGAQSIGSFIMLSCLEHMPNLWTVPEILSRILKPGGRCFMLTPWNLRFHGPRPDCWRISDDGYTALFGSRFKIESIEKIPCPHRPLSPVGIKCVVRQPNR